MTNIYNLLNLQQISDMIGKPRETVWRWMRRDGGIEPVFRGPSLTLFEPIDVMNWLEAHHGGKYAEQFRAASQNADGV